MNYKQFIETVKVRISGLIGPDREVITKTILKVNDTKKIGILIKEEGNDLMPTIYLEEYFEMYEKGRDIDQIVDDIILLNATATIPEVKDMTTLMHFDNMKNKIMYRIINKERNQELLKTMPHREYLDFAITYYVLMEAELTACMTIKVENYHLEKWNITEEELYVLAKENTSRDMEVSLRHMNEVLCSGTPFGKKGFTQEESYMYSLTNYYVHYGAATLLYDGVLEKIHDKIGHDFYVFPSSVHDLVIFPQKEDMDIEFLQDMVSSGNCYVYDDEFLSSNAYRYTHGSGLSLCK